MNERRPTRGQAAWERPHLLSVSVPVVEELLAESYRRKAEMWADAARQLRTQPNAAHQAAQAPNGAASSEPSGR